MILAVTQLDLSIQYICKEKFQQEIVEQRFHSEEVLRVVEIISRYWVCPDLMDLETKQLKQKYVRTRES